MNVLKRLLFASQLARRRLQKYLTQSHCIQVGFQAVSYPPMYIVASVHVLVHIHITSCCRNCHDWNRFGHNCRCIFVSPPGNSQRKYRSFLGATFRVQYRCPTWLRTLRIRTTKHSPRREVDIGASYGQVKLVPKLAS